MPTFPGSDGTELAYHIYGDGEGYGDGDGEGEGYGDGDGEGYGDGEGDGDGEGYGGGAALLCVPGGPMRASAYLGDLGGLSAHRRLVMLDLRGTGDSAVPVDPASYRCDHQADDVAALQDHLGLASVDLLAHSAGANIAVQYVALHPHRVSRLVLITPSGRAVGLEPDKDARRQVMRLRRREPWYANAAAAFDRIEAGSQSDDDWNALAPFFYGRWDAVAQAHWAAAESQTNEDAAAVFAADGAFDPEATRAGLAGFGAPVLVLAGGFDHVWPAAVVHELAGLFPAAEFIVQPGAGHFAWLDDPVWFVSAIDGFLNDGL
jgi:proline iminopeptidase